MFVFGRDTVAPHGRLAELAKELTNDPEESRRAVGWNILYDHRISEARAADFYLRYTPASVQEFERALRDYFWDVVCKAPDQSYLSPSLNENNFVNRLRLPSDLRFANVLNLTAWAKTVHWEDRLDFFLRSRKTLDDDYDFLSDFLSAISSSWDLRPIWLARWTDFERFVEFDRPSTWNKSVGAWRQEGDWQIVLQLLLPETKQLLRPTQFDVGFYQYHFPSPPTSHPTEGGIAMELREIPRNNQFVAEWLHPPLPLTIEHWLRANNRLAAIDESTNRVFVYRSQHRERLSVSHPGKWIPIR